MHDQKRYFEAKKLRYVARYFAGPYMFIVGLFFYFFLWPILTGDKLTFFYGIKRFFFEDSKLSMFMIFIMAILPQIVGFFQTQGETKLLEVGLEELVFNYFNGKQKRLRFVEIEKFGFTDDIFKNFEFIMKSGEKFIVYPSMRNKEEAYKLIEERIEENRIIKDSKL